ncbi:MAG: FAD binding domain-containing protein [Coprococcus sp.]
MLWLKMSNRNMHTAIDLSGLGLDKIEEQEDAFSIDVCVHFASWKYYEAGRIAILEGCMKACTRHIVGTQFRNGATVGGKAFWKIWIFGYIDCLLALDTYVELYRGRCDCVI